MAFFESYFFDGALSLNPPTEDSQNIYFCDIDISDGLIRIDYYPSIPKKDKYISGSLQMQVCDAQIGERKTVKVSIASYDTVIISDNNKTFTLANIKEIVGKNILNFRSKAANQFRQAELDEIIAAVNTAKNT